MRYGVRVICRPEVAGGFALAGTARLEALRSQDEVGVVLMEEGFHQRIPADLTRELARSPLPMVVPFAGPDWTGRTEDVGAYIVELLRQAIGYRVRLR
jgi:vacuolar-type H+-ATPase subunit F/Vma7